MIKTFLACIGLVVMCSGCESVPRPVTNQPKPAISCSEKKENIKSQTVGFLPEYRSDLSDKYADAVNIYDSSPKASQGVYCYEGIVFVIVTIDTKIETIEYLEGTSMLRVVAMLREKYPNLPAKFNLRNRLVEKGLDDETGIYRYAVAYREASIKAKQPK